MSSLVKLEWHNPAIACISMQDVANNNVLNENLINALTTALTQINENSEAKVAILTGLDNYFCCGNLELNTNKNFSAHHGVLNCSVPVIAAANGDALGDGLILSLFADMLIFAEEAHYSTHFLQTSFTPEISANYILNKKFGPLLNNEFLYTKQLYDGNALKLLNAPIRIVKKEKVMPTALDIAKDLAEKPAISLRLLKKNMTQILNNEIQQCQHYKYEIN